MPKKHLGQNFLINPGILDKIIKVSDLSKNDIVIEIGTGPGNLTHKIAEKVKKVITFDVDQELLSQAKENLKEFSNIEFRNTNILELRPTSHVLRPTLKILGNLPYYITTPILEWIFNLKKKPKLITIMVQKEVAQRMVAQPGSKTYGRLSIYTQLYTNPKIEFYVSKGSFNPMPKIDSAVLTLKPKNPPTPYGLRRASLKTFERIVKAAFGKRRKTLRNALIKSTELNIDPDLIDKALAEAGIDPKRRAETLSIDEFYKLSSILVEPS